MELLWIFRIVHWLTWVLVDC